MNKEGKILLATVLLFVFFQLGHASAADNTNACDLDVSLVNQDPSPAVPGEYVKLLFQVSGLNNPSCRGVDVELVPTYPFYYDGEDQIKIINGPTFTNSYSSVWNVGYKVRIDDNAVEGENEITLKYKEKGEVYFTSQEFPIEIEDALTSFDAVIQEQESQSITVALANIGKNTANSVIVRIPEQEAYKTIGTNGQMVGNLEAGDYTIVAFDVQKTNRGEDTLSLEISYTDSIGERRVQNLDISMSSGTAMIYNESSTSTLPTDFAQRRKQMLTQQSTGTSPWTYLLYVIIVLAVVILIVKRKKIKELFHKDKKHTSSKDNEWFAKEKTIKKESK